MVRNPRGTLIVSDKKLGGRPRQSKEGDKGGLGAEWQAVGKLS